MVCHSSSDSCPWFQKYCIGYADLANVIEQTAPVNFSQGRHIGKVVAGKDQGVGCHALRVQTGFTFPQIQSCNESLGEFFVGMRVG
jgi:hypothetical protein